MANSKLIKLIKKLRMNVNMNNMSMPILRRSPRLRLCPDSPDPFEPKKEQKTSIKKLSRNHK